MAMALDKILETLVDNEMTWLPNPLGDSVHADMIQQRVVWTYMRLGGTDPFYRMDSSTMTRLESIVRSRQGNMLDTTVNQTRAEEGNVNNHIVNPPPPPGLPILYPPSHGGSGDV